MLILLGLFVIVLFLIPMVRINGTRKKFRKDFENVYDILNSLSQRIAKSAGESERLITAVGGYHGDTKKNINDVMELILGIKQITENHTDVLAKIMIADDLDFKFTQPVEGKMEIVKMDRKERKERKARAPKKSKK